MRQRRIWVSILCTVISILILCRINVQAATKEVQGDIKGSLRIITAGQVSQHHID